MNINPTLMPLKKRIKSLKDLRGYALGERNPDTLPNEVDSKSEKPEQNVTRSAHWSSLRKKVEAGRLIGSKY